MDLSKHWIDFNCPACSYTGEVTLREVKLGSTIFCHNCKATIKLIDNNASVETSLNKVERAMGD